MSYIPGKKKELMDIDRLYESISSFSFKKNILNEGSLVIKDISNLSKFPSSALKSKKYFIIHHTAGRGTAEDVVNILNTRKNKSGKTIILGIQYIIDRNGNVFKGTKGSKGAHIASFYPSAPKDMSNSTAEGVEIIASDDSDILIPQCKSTLLLIKSLGYPLSSVYGHGEVSSNKMKTEGATCKAYVTKYWSTPESELPDVDTTLNTNVSDKKDTKDKKEEKPKENKSKETPTQKNETFCKCLSDEKNKSSSTWVFKDAVKKCDSSTAIDAAIALAKLCKTNNTTTTTTGSNNKEKPEEKWSDKIKFSFSDMFKGVSLEEQKIVKNIERIKKIL
jgi:hypothetical protein